MNGGGILSTGTMIGAVDTGIAVVSVTASSLELNALDDTLVVLLITLIVKSLIFKF